jgi:hypothetical protein
MLSTAGSFISFKFFMVYLARNNHVGNLKGHQEFQI